MIFKILSHSKENLMENSSVTLLSPTCPRTLSRACPIEHEDSLQWLILLNLSLMPNDNISSVISHAKSSESDTF